MDTMSQAAERGYANPSEPTPYIHSSPLFYAHWAGALLALQGASRPVKATMGRGYSVNIWTVANRYRAHFKDDANPSIERL